jgi:hypothetical protein
MAFPFNSFEYQNGAILSHGFDCSCDSDSFLSQDRRKFIEDANAAREWLKNTPIPVVGEALVKTCENSGDFIQTVENKDKNYLDINAVWIFQRDGKVSPFPARTPFFHTYKDFFDFEEIQKKAIKRQQPKPIIKAASNFSRLASLRFEQSQRYKSINPNDLEFLEFVGNTFESFRSINNKTGEVSTFTRKGKKDVLVQPREKIISDRFSLQTTMAKVVPKHRVSKCFRVVQDKQKALTVYKSNNFNSVSVSNLQTCGSVWDCPVCAAKITERRRKEVNQAIDAHKLDGGSVSFVTRTVPHTKDDSLLDMRNKFRKADSLMKGHSSYKSLVKRLGVIGSIKVYEVTVGEFNGWHLHVHEIFFHSKDAPFDGDAVSTNSDYAAFLETFRAGLYARWKVDAVKAGFNEPSEEHGLQVQNGDFAADYFAKWGVESSSSWDASSELTKAHIKKSKKGFSPFDLLRCFRDTGDESLIPILREYSESMFGQRQLIWSRGLKAHFGIDDIDDEELVEELEDDAEEIGVLSPDQWRFIAKNDLRAEFYLFSLEGWGVLTSFLTSFDDYPAFSMLQNLDDSD